MVSLCLSVTVLLRILTVFPYLPKSISEPLHNLLLSQMADKTFKKDLAIAYAEGYVLFTEAYGRGYGTADFCIYSLSVQFLNRDFLVSEIVDYHDFFANLCVAIDDMLESACGVFRVEGAQIGCAEERERSERMLRHPILTHRRYNPMFADLKVRYRASDLGPKIPQYVDSTCRPHFFSLICFLSRFFFTLMVHMTAVVWCSGDM